MLELTTIHPITPVKGEEKQYGALEGKNGSEDWCRGTLGNLELSLLHRHHFHYLGEKMSRN